VPGSVNAVEVSIDPDTNPPISYFLYAGPALLPKLFRPQEDLRSWMVVLLMRTDRADADLLRVTAGEEVPDRLERSGCQPRRLANAGTDYISLGLYVIVQLVGVVNESGAEWDTEVVPTLSEGERSSSLFLRFVG
jgi:hypothetical protein